MLNDNCLFAVTIREDVRITEAVQVYQTLVLLPALVLYDII